MHICRIFCTFAAKLNIKPKIMARPIKETPILFGEDALRFMDRAQRVESLSRDERIANRRMLETRVANARNHIEVCW